MKESYWLLGLGALLGVGAFSVSRWRRSHRVGDIVKIQPMPYGDGHVTDLAKILEIETSAVTLGDVQKGEPVYVLLRVGDDPAYPFYAVQKGPQDQFFMLAGFPGKIHWTKNDGKITDYYSWWKNYRNAPLPPPRS